MQFDYGRNFSGGSAAVQLMMQQLGGTQVRYRILMPKNQKIPKGHPDRESRRKGYAFLASDAAPKANNKNQFVEWTDEQINTPSSPVYNWTASEVKETLRNHAQAAANAKTIDRWPLNLKDNVHPQIVEKIVAPIVRDSHRFSTCIIGGTRTGKSSLSKTIGINLSAYNICTEHDWTWLPSVVTTKKIDFLRLEPGNKKKPAIGDDIFLSKLDPDELKAFADPGEEDALMWARWGATQMAMGQWRCFCLNPYDKKSEPEKSCSVVRQEIEKDDFLKMISVNFPKASTDEDVEAYLNRMHIVLLTDKWIYHWQPLCDMERVPRMPWPDPKRRDLFVPDVRVTMARYKKDQLYKPDGFLDRMIWDLEPAA